MDETDVVDAAGLVVEAAFAAEIVDLAVQPRVIEEHAGVGQAQRGRPLENLAAGADGGDVLLRISGLRADMEGQSLDADAEPVRLLNQFQSTFRAAAELLGEIGICVGVAEAQADEQFGLVPIGNEFLQLVAVVDHKNRAAVRQCVTDV